MDNSQTSFWEAVERHAKPAYMDTIGLRDDRFPWLGVYPSNFNVRSAVMAACLDANEPATHFVTIEGGRCTTRRDFARTWGDALEFPRYYGGNIDAFEECFRDLLIIDEGGIGSQFGGRPGRPVDRLVINVEQAELVLHTEDRIGPARIIEIIDVLRAWALERSCDLRVVYLVENQFPERQMLDRFGLEGAHRDWLD